MSNVLGISSYYHDSAASLINEHGILGAIQEERLSRLKGDANFPLQSIKKLLELNKLTEGDIDLVAYYERRLIKLSRLFKTQIIESPMGWRQTKTVFQEHSLESYRLKSKIKKLGISAPIIYFPHHKSHAASAFYASGFKESTILTIDGVGEFATTTISKGSQEEIKILKQIDFPHSIGLLYATITAFCGFKVNSGEYKLMGLAPYGEPIYVDLILEKIVKIFDDGSIRLNLKYFDFTRATRMYSNHMSKLFGIKPRHTSEFIEKSHCDLASSIQKILNMIMGLMVQYAVSITHEKNVCLAGGVALNCVANSHLTSIVHPSNLFIQPAAGDAGGSLGAAYLGALMLHKNLKLKDSNPINLINNFKMTNAFLGTSYSYRNIEQVIIDNKLKYTIYADFNELDETVARHLTNGCVVGFFRGKMEFGPRSLGARSILADPRNIDMQKHLNLKIKNRESFRPFAPVILQKFVSEWFTWPANVSADYMLITAQVKDEVIIDHDSSFPSSGLLTEMVSRPRSRIPAITHVDLSARIQTVSELNPIFGLLSKFNLLTNVPILINTSFNVRGEPIVESPQNAVDCFLQTDMDILAIENFLLIKSEQSDSIIENSKINRKVWELD